MRCPRTLQGRGLCPARREVPAAGMATGPWPSNAAGVATGPWPSNAAGVATGPWPSNAAGVATGTWPSNAAGVATGTLPSNAAGVATGTWPSNAAGVATGTLPSNAAGVATGPWPSNAAGPATGPWPSNAPGVATGTWPSNRAQDSQRCAETLNPRARGQAGGTGVGVHKAPRSANGQGEEQHNHTSRGSHTRRDEGECSRQGGGQRGTGGNQDSGNRNSDCRGWESIPMGGSDNTGDGLANQPRHYPCSTGIRRGVSPATSVLRLSITCLVVFPCVWGRLKRSARAVQLFGRLAVLEDHTLRY